MNKTILRLMPGIWLVSGFSFYTPSSATEGYLVPRTEWDQPDLQGVWNFSSNVPMERPENFGEREFLSEEEIAEVLASQFATNDDNTEQVPLPAGEVGKTYDDFWNEQTARDNSFRTSLIVYPRNGRVPQLKDGIAVQFGTRGVEKTAERPARHLARGIGTVSYTHLTLPTIYSV